VNYPPQGPPPQGPLPGNFGAPQGHPGQWGPPPQQPPWPQQQWPPSPPPKKRNGWKWALGAVALLTVIGVTAAVTISVTSGGDGGDPTPAEETYGLASADDRGPVDIIREDPSCAVWAPVNDAFAAVQKKGWSKRDPTVPRSQWTFDQRTQFEEVGRAAREAAERTVTAAKLTPHRVMRELYLQFIAYARAYSDSLDSYEPHDESLARVMTNSGAAIIYACAAINFGSAAARGPLVEPGPTPSIFAPLQNPEEPTQFLANGDSVCSDWIELLEKYDAETEDWQAIDSAISSSDWTPEQRTTIDKTIPKFIALADSLEDLGRKTSNAWVQDFAFVAAQYRRAYAEALPTYTAADSWLASTAGSVGSTVYNACQAAS
jgi:hypothetical protein